LTGFGQNSYLSCAFLWSFCIYHHKLCISVFLFCRISEIAALWNMKLNCLGMRPEAALESEVTRLDADFASYSMSRTHLQHSLLGQ